MTQQVPRRTLSLSLSLSLLFFLFVSICFFSFSFSLSRRVVCVLNACAREYCECVRALALARMYMRALCLRACVCLCLLLYLCFCVYLCTCTPTHVSARTGGGLTMAVLLFLRDRQAPLPAAGMCLSGWFDPRCQSPGWGAEAGLDYLPSNAHSILLRCTRAYVEGEGEAASSIPSSCAPVSHPYITPLLASLRGLPPLLLQAGGAERLCHDVEAMAARLKEAGVYVELEVYPHEVHVFHVFHAIWAPARDALQSLARFVRMHARANTEHVARTLEDATSRDPTCSRL